jgi:hypothetical protein
MTPKELITTREPGELSEELRHGTGRLLNNRRGVVGLSLIAMGSMGLISLYQMGVIKHLPEPPLPYMDADKVDASDEAYAKFSMPDAVTALGSYAVTAGLASIGGQDRATTQPLVPLAMATKVVFDSINAGKLTVDQWTKHKAFCFWCLVGAAATFSMVPLVIEEAYAALRQLVGKR